MKRLLIVVLMICCFSGCAKEVEPQENVQVVNPIVECESLTNLEEQVGFKVSFDALNASEMSFRSIMKSIAEICFTYNENQLVLRASKELEGLELAGLYYEFSESELDGYHLYKNEECMAVCYDVNEVHYSIYLSTILDDEALLELLNGVVK